MTTTKSTPGLAPNFVLHREVKEAVDSGDITNVKSGMNMEGFSTCIIDVSPSTLADPSIQILFWSENHSKFVAENSPVSYPGAGAGKGYQQQVDCAGRVMFVFVDSGVTTGDTVKIGVAGCKR